MKAIFTAVCVGALAALSNNFAVAECALDMTPTTRAALLESAGALTRCSAFYHTLAATALLGENTDKIKLFQRWSGLARENIIVATLMVNMAASPDKDPTMKFNEYQDSLGTSSALGGADWARRFSAQCEMQMVQANKVIMDYRDGR